MIDINQALQTAIGMHQAGRLQDAERVLMELLRHAPKNPDALHILGVIAHQSGNSVKAAQWIEQAIACKPNAPLYFNSLGMVMAAMRRLGEAEQAYRRALRLKPDWVVVYNNLGNVLSDMGDVEGACKHYRQALQRQPDYPEVHNNLAEVLRTQGMLEQARQHGEEAVRLRPDFFEARFNLGNILRESGDLEGAVRQYQLVLRARPDFVLARLNLGNVLKEQNKLDAAIESYQKILSASPDHVEALYNLGNAQHEAGRLDAAMVQYQRVLSLQPGHMQARNNLRNVYAKLVPGWHFPMMNDGARNQAYEKALARVVTPDSVVLDIGSGSGLLALMAARAGARQVITTEMVPILARKAREIVKRNGFDQVVTVLDKKSTALRVGVDLPQRADLLVTEIFDVGLLGEQAIASIQHARANLLQPDARIIPSHAVVRAALLESDRLWQEGFVTEVCGFDLSLFNEFHRDHLQKELQAYPHRMLSLPYDLFEFDFCREPIRDASLELPVTVTASGVCHGMVYWFRLFLDADQVIDTAPDQVHSHWMQAIQLFPEPLAVQVDEVLTLRASHNRQAISLDLVRSVKESNA